MLRRLALTSLYLGMATTATAASLTPADRGKAVTLAMGETLEIVLPENPTTGYQWQVERCDCAVFAAAPSRAYRQTPAAPGMVGVGGHVVFTLTATKPGIGALRLSHRRAWEDPSRAVEQFEVTATVRAAGQ